MVQILDSRGQPFPTTEKKVRSTVTPVRLKYDAAVTDSENARHWSLADDLSAAAANSPDVRRILRRRSRYERGSNSYYDGIVSTLANYLIGTGPRIQVRLPNQAAAKRITDSFELWSEEIHLSQKLHTFKQAACVDGESFLLFSTDENLDHDVKLDVQLIECDQISTPYEQPVNQYSVDGIEFDDNWKPVFYHLLKSHPGDTNWWSMPTEYDSIPASLVVHWFQQTRPRMFRGIPATTSALPLFAQLRRYTLAVIAAAETAADFSGVLQSQLPPDEDFTEGDPFEAVEIVKRMLLTLPSGYTIQQFKAEQPATTYAMFKKEILEEISRCMNIPFAIASGNSADLNYASGRLDHQVFFNSIGVEQYNLECRVLTPIFRAWCREARQVTDLLPDGKIPPRVWFWPGFKHVDPQKESNAEKTRLESGTTTYQEVYAAQGWDWKEKFQEMAEATEFAKKLGLTIVGMPEEPEVEEEEEQEEPPVPRKKKAVAAMNGHSDLRLSGENSGGGEALTFTAPVDIQAAAGDKKRPRFSIVGYTGRPMDVEGYFYPLIIDLKGVLAPRSQSVPALMRHDPDRIVGQTDGITIGEKIELTGIVTGDNDDTREVLSQAANGFKWQSSVGAAVHRREFLESGKSATVNGRNITGPMIIARETQLKEISFVALGADNSTSATLAASANNPLPLPERSTEMNFEKWLELKGFSSLALNDTAKATLRAMYDAEQASRNPPAPPAPPAPPSPPVRAEGGNGSGGRLTLEEVVQAQLDEDRRQDRITAMAAEAISERPAMAEQIRAMAQASIDGNTPLERFETEILRLRVKINGNSHRNVDRRVQSNVIEAALARNCGVEDLDKVYGAQTLEASERSFPHGLGLVETLQLGAYENGAGRVSSRDVVGLLRGAFQQVTQVQAFGFSTISIPGILSNVANKSLAAGFNAVDNSWRSISARRSVKDFKANTSYSLVGNHMMYEEVGPTGEIKHASLSELPYLGRARTYARMLSITRQDIINDDLGSISQVPKMLGRGAALKRNDLVWSTFLNNAAFFTSGHANVITGVGSALSLTSLASASTLFDLQTGPDGEPLGITPAILLVPSALRITAMQLINSTQIANSTYPNTVQMADNPFAGLYTVVSTPYLSNTKYTGASTSGWYLLASPADMPVIEVQFLNGRETPILDTAQADFDTLGVQMRGVHDFGVSLQEYRGGVRAAGV